MMNNSKKGPVVIYDEQCKFCIGMVNKFKIITKNFITFTPIQNLSSDYESLNIKTCQKSIHYIDKENNISRGAEAIFQILELTNRGSFLHILYRKIRIFRIFTEIIYNTISKNRNLL